MPAVNDNKYVVNATWDDAPHLTQAQKDELWESIPPHERDARTKGVPSLGAGAIYPIDESKYTVDDFEIPDFWPRAYAMDVGWRCTAAIWGAWDQQSDIVYLYSCYKQGLAEPATHVEAIKSRGDWIPGVIDPAAQGRAQKDGLRLFDEYQTQGLNLNLADNAVESGIFAVYRRLISGRLKAFKSLAPFFEEMRLYRRGENGKIVKDNDHLCDCLHGETLVITSDGKIKIKDLVGRTGKVLTIGGVYTNFYDCKKTHEKADAVVVRFDDGSRVRCTRDHLFMTTSGWVKAVDMAGELCYDAVTQSINNNKGDSTCSKSKFYQTKNSSTKGKTIGNVGNISNATGFGCTEKYTKMLRGKSKKIFACIIWMKTRTITPLKTLCLSTKDSTCQYIQKDCQGSLAKPRLMVLRNGMALKKEENGTRSIMKNLITCCIEDSLKLAKYVVRFLTLPLLVNSAPITASQHIAGGQGSMMSISNARSVENCSRSISTVRRNSAHDHAVIRAVSVKSSDPCPTYCMTVPENHAFAVENGTVVHNCMRYLLMSGMQIAKSQLYADAPLYFDSKRKSVNSITGY